MNNYKNNQNIFNETLFISKLLDLKLYLFIFDNFNNNIKINDNMYYYIKINTNDKIILLISTDKNYNFNQEIDNENYNKLILDYKNIFYYLNKIDDKYINEKNLNVFWKNQFLVSNIIDSVLGGWILNPPNNWGSYNKNIENENELNEKIFNKINEWLKKKNTSNYIDLENEKIKELIN